MRPIWKQEVKLRSPGSKVQVLYTCTQQWNEQTIDNYECKKTREKNRYKNNSSNNGTVGAIVLRDKEQVTIQ